MRKVLFRSLFDLFTPREFQDIDVYKVLDVLGDPVTRKTWLFEVLSEIKQINLKIDSKLMSGEMFSINDLSARRRGLQFVLETALEASRKVKRDKGQNPEPGYDLDSVTVNPAPH